MNLLLPSDYTNHTREMHTCLPQSQQRNKAMPLPVIPFYCCMTVCLMTAEYPAPPGEIDNMLSLTCFSFFLEDKLDLIFLEDVALTLFHCPITTRHQINKTIPHRSKHIRSKWQCHHYSLCYPAFYSVGWKYQQLWSH